MFLVVGATGQIGNDIARGLRAALPASTKVRGLTRGAARPGAKPLPEGVERVEGDLASSLDHAFAGVERAFVMTHASPSMKAHVANAVSAAKKAGTRRIVFLSSYSVASLPKSAIGRWHREGEDVVEEAGLEYTFLRPGNFSSNALRWADTIRAAGSVFDASNGSTSAPIDPRDIAAVGLAALLDDKGAHRNQRYVLTGAEEMTVAQQVDVVARVTGRPIKHVPIPAAGARAGMVKSGMPEFMVDAVMELITGHEEGLLMTSTVKDVLGRAPHTFESWAKAHAAHFA